MIFPGDVSDHTSSHVRVYSAAKLLDNSEVFSRRSNEIKPDCDAMIKRSVDKSRVRCQRGGESLIEGSCFVLGMRIGPIYFWQEGVVRNWNSERVDTCKFQRFKVEVRN